jgi:hypothetical protein
MANNISAGAIIRRVLTFLPLNPVGHNRIRRTRQQQPSVDSKNNFATHVAAHAELEGFARLL